MRKKWLWVGLALTLSARLASQTLELLPTVVVASRLDDEEEEEREDNRIILGEEAMRKSQTMTVTDLLESEAGVPFLSFYGNGRQASPLLRGFGENTAARVLVLVDGMPVSRPDLAGSSWGAYPLAALGQVELLRGGQTVRYGSGAMAGVILIDTKNDVVEKGANMEVRYGSDETFAAQLGAEVPVADWSLQANANSFQSEGFRRHSASESEVVNVSLASPLDAADRVRWTFSAHRESFEDPGSLSKDEYLKDPRTYRYERFPAPLVGDFLTSEEGLQFGQTTRHQPSEDWEWTSRLGFNKRKREIQFGLGNQSDNDLLTWNGETVLSWSPGNHLMQAGLRAAKEDLDVTRYRDEARNDAFAHAALQRESVGVFAIAELQIAEAWNVQGGVSYDSYRISAVAQNKDDPAQDFLSRGSDQGWGAEAALSYEVSEYDTARLRYHRVYRFPLLDELAAYQGFPLATPFNQELRAEAGHGFDIGWSHDEEDLSWSSTLYGMWLDGEILFNPLLNLNENSAQTRRWGLESRVEWRPQNWRFLLAHNFSDARFVDGIDKGRRLPLVPKHTATLSARWSPCAQWAIGAELVYVSDSPDGAAQGGQAYEEIPERYLLNFLGEWKLSEEFNLFFRVNNIMDDNHALAKYQDRWYPGAGRQYMMGARYSF